MIRRNHRTTLALSTAAVLGLAAGSALAQAPAPIPSTVRTETAVATIKVPSTAADHVALAATYRARVAAQRAEAALHRKMKADYRERVHVHPKGPENQLLKKMDKHCDQLIDEAVRQAVIAERYAQYHDMRAEEVQGYPLEMFGANGGERVAEARPAPTQDR